MSEQLFWQQLGTLGGLQQAWWYNGMVTPALLIAVFALITVCFALRHVEQRVIVFLFCLLACVPLMLIIPSAYAALRPQEALALVGVPWPGAANQVPRQTAQTLGAYLNLLAQIGSAGAMLGLLLGLSGLIMASAGTNVPILSTVARQVTEMATRRLRKGGSATSAQPSVARSQYGRLIVLTGKHTKTQQALRPGYLIGREAADIVITDPVVSRRHAQIDHNVQGQTTITDLGSTNGVFVYRVDPQGAQERHIVSGTAFPLRPGDEITLGDPDDVGEDAVRLRFEID